MGVRRRVVLVLASNRENILFPRHRAFLSASTLILQCMFFLDNFSDRLKVICYFNAFPIKTHSQGMP